MVLWSYFLDPSNPQTPGQDWFWTSFIHFKIVCTALTVNDFGRYLFSLKAKGKKQQLGLTQFCYHLCCTSFEGLRRTSPTPPPLLRPWLNTVTMHMSSESQLLSLSSITTAGGWTATEAKNKKVTSEFLTAISCVTLNATHCLRSHHPQDMPRKTATMKID